MANKIAFKLMVLGTESNVAEFLSVLSCDDYCDNGKDSYHGSFPRHFWRVDCIEQISSEIRDNNHRLLLSGECVHSVSYSMTEYDESLYHIHNHEYANHGTSLERETAKLGISVEIYSRTQDSEEHYLIVNGEIIISESIPYEEVYWDRNTFPSVEALNAALGTNYTLNNYNKETNCFFHGGFNNGKDFEEWIL